MNTACLLLVLVFGGLSGLSLILVRETAKSLEWLYQRAASDSEKYFNLFLKQLSDKKEEED